jgi:hypothetical protein
MNETTLKIVLHLEGYIFSITPRPNQEFEIEVEGLGELPCKGVEGIIAWAVEHLSPYGCSMLANAILLVLHEFKNVQQIN